MCQLQTTDTPREIGNVEVTADVIGLVADSECDEHAFFDAGGVLAQMG
jgi:hypothetical protein